MEATIYKITIDAQREKVWDVLWADKTYREWTEVFSEGSQAKTDWKQGSKVYFVNDQDEGMVSEIAENISNEYMSIRHLGMYSKGVEDLDSEKVKKWAGAMENYHLEIVDGKTQLTVTIEFEEEYKDYFDNTWPKALDKVKELSEN